MKAVEGVVVTCGAVSWGNKKLVRNLWSVEIPFKCGVGRVLPLSSVF